MIQSWPWLENVHWSNVVFQKQILTTNSCIHFWPRALRSLVLLMQQKLHRIKEARIHDSTSLHSTRFQGYLKLTQAILMANPLMLSHDIKYQKDCKHGNYNCACGLHFKYKYQLFLFYSVKCHHKWWCMAKQNGYFQSIIFYFSLRITCTMSCFRFDSPFRSKHQKEFISYANKNESPMSKFR